MCEWWKTHDHAGFAKVSISVRPTCTDTDCFKSMVGGGVIAALFAYLQERLTFRVVFFRVVNGRCDDVCFVVVVDEQWDECKL